ncbi:MAG: hypothetical protein HYI21_03690 [Sediminibacterium sp. Gen4]|jgi:hypothetical protein|uniref:hypothetical protein n=1 Tax=unclassified Sediminibacterium TaxID=2635961 RepID=UPI0015BBE5FF|nr:MULTISPECIES: hypothetical protein [unclassified Sediminibacterium]MBW0161915.1 hypothetical protein [Sediminibacterium sp.]MBW0165319.1 hypothetical protein [Sediminibacterium sp.]NWK65108.1 hypothetical protein [Sediminibacterium sp. Gen4]
MEHFISLQEAIDMTSHYQVDVPAGMVNSEMFCKDSVLALLSQPGCASLRIYYGKQENGTIHAILVGVDENGADMVQTSDLILEEGVRCPPFCPTTSSPLNG